VTLGLARFTRSPDYLPASDPPMSYEIDVFSAALNLPLPWKVASSRFSGEDKSLHLELDFDRGSRFACPECGDLCPIHDTIEKQWRHLNFFQYKAFLHARVPRISCPKHRVLQVDPPCSRPGSGFTLLFEAFILMVAKDMPVLALADMVGEHDTRIWRILHHYVDEARAHVDMSGVEKVGFDETSSRRGHDYISIFVDMQEGKVLFATPGKDAETVKSFAQDLKEHGGDPLNIREASIDMSPAFIKGTEENLPNAAITFDKFHVSKLISEALQETRREEQKESPEHYALLKHSHFSLLKGELKRNEVDNERIKSITLSRLNMKTARAWKMKETFRNVCSLSGDLGVERLAKWCSWAVRSRIEPMKRAARSIRKHWDGVIQYFYSRITNAILESINGRIQAARAKACGYRNKRYMICMLYLIAGKLNLPQFHSK
jgi:transposase